MTLLRLWARLVTLPSDLEIFIQNLQKQTGEFVWIICTVRNLRNLRVRTGPEKSLIDAHGREACAALIWGYEVFLIITATCVVCLGIWE